MIFESILAQPQPASSQHRQSLQSQLTMLLTSPKKLKHRENELLARTGVSKAGYLLKRQSSSSLTSQWRWESTFLILNSHTLSYCSQKDNFNKPVGNLLLTASTRVYHQAEEAVIRVETGVEVMLLKGRDMTDIKEWKKAIHSNVEKLTELARGQFGVKCKSGKVTDHFLMLHRECITSHPSYNRTLIINNIYPLTSQTTFTVQGNCIKIKGEDIFIAKNDIEHKNFVHALKQIISALQSEGTKMIVDPPQFPIHSGTLLSLDASTMQWTKKYLVLTDDSIFIHGRRRVGFDAARQHKITPNSTIFSTTLKPYSFEVVLFSESIHLAAASEREENEWMYVLHGLISQSSYDLNDPLQAASLERVTSALSIEFQCSSAPGIIIDRRGHFAMASIVHATLSRKVSIGSILSMTTDLLY